MKKIWVLICALIMVLALAACKGNVKSTQDAVSGVSQTDQTVSSDGGESGTVSSETPQVPVSSGDVVSQAPKVPNQKAISGENTGAYEYKSKSYSYKNENMVYTASYPVFSGKISNVDKINEAMKTCALKTINSLGTAKKTAKTTVKVNGDVVYEGKNFISVGFNEYVKRSPKEEATHTLRTVNVNLKTGAIVEAKDLIVKNDAFYKALETAAKSQLSPDVAKAVTADAIKSGLDSSTIYFFKYGVGFSAQISKPSKRLVKLTLTFDQAKPFMTNNEIWKNFI